MVDVLERVSLPYAVVDHERRLGGTDVLAQRRAVEVVRMVNQRQQTGNGAWSPTNMTAPIGAGSKGDADG
jgi:hypothetical protein